MGILDYRIGLSDRTSKGILDSGFNLDGSEMSPKQQEEYEQFKKDNNMSSIPFRSNNLAMGMSISDAQPLSETLGMTFDTDGIRSLPFNRDYSESELMESDTTTKDSIFAGLKDKIDPSTLLNFITNLYSGGTKQSLTSAGILKAFGNVRDAIGNRLGPSAYGTSQNVFNNMTPAQQQAVGSIYGPRGIMQGYNAVSAFGRGPVGAIENRIANILGRKAPQTAASRAKVKQLQQALTDIGGGDSGSSFDSDTGGTFGSSVDDASTFSDYS